MNNLKILPTNKIWPEEWDKHILNTVQFYFEDHSIVFDDFSYSGTNNLSVIFLYQHKKYIITVKMFTVFVSKEMPQPNNNIIDTHPTLFKYITMIMIKDSYDFCEQIEKIILNDNDDDGGNDKTTPSLDPNLLEVS
jgi:hypothetical protein